MSVCSSVTASLLTSLTTALHKIFACLGKTGNSSRVSLAPEVRSRGVIFTRARSTIPEESRTQGNNGSGDKEYPVRQMRLRDGS